MIDRLDYNLAKGQTLIETLVGIVVASLLIVGITGVTLTILRNSSANDNASLALSYAQEGQEYFRNLYNSNPNAFDTAYLPSTSGCLKDITKPNPVDTTGADCLNTANLPNNGLSRSFQIQRTVGGDCPNNSGVYENIQLNINVSWTDSKCQPNGAFCHASLLETCISNAASL